MCLVDDDGEVPDIFCNDERCLQVFHKACLVQVRHLNQLWCSLSVLDLRDKLVHVCGFLLCSGYALVQRAA